MSVFKYSWDEIKTIVQKVNPEFSEILDTSPIIKKYPFTVYEYQFGELIADNNYFYAPNDTKIQPITKVPFSMILENKIEQYVGFVDKLFTYQILSPGRLLQLTSFVRNDRLHSPNDMLTFTAGARNILLLPEIAEKNSHDSLCHQFSLKHLPPKNMDSQFEIFRDIIQKSNSTWRFKLLIFPKKWVEKMQEKHNDPATAYIRELSLNISGFKRNLILYDFILSYIKNEFKLSPNDFVNDAVRQLFCLGAGQTPGFGAVTDESMIPYKIIEEAYNHYYEIKHAPILIGPKYLEPFETNTPIYYSLKKPAFLYSMPPTASTLKLCLDIKSVFEAYCEQIKKAGLAKNTIFYKLANKLAVDVMSDFNGPTKNSGFLTLENDIAEYDKHIANKLQQLNFNNKSLTCRSSFFKGCFGIKYKVSEE